MDIGMPELLIVLVIVLLVFGVGRLGKIGGELGTAIRQFRDGLKSDDVPPVKNDNAPVTETKPATSGEDFTWNGFDPATPRKEEKG
jgi:sec-independent protein translocase protein TatA